MRFVGTGHGDGSELIFQSIIGFVANRPAGLFRVHAGFETATLDHEIGDHPMKQGAIVESVLGVLEKVGDRSRGAGVVQFEDNNTKVGMQMNHDLDHFL